MPTQKELNSRYFIDYRFFFSYCLFAFFVCLYPDFLLVIYGFWFCGVFFKLFLSVCVSCWFSFSFLFWIARLFLLFDFVVVACLLFLFPKERGKTDRARSWVCREVRRIWKYIVKKNILHYISGKGILSFNSNR